MQRKPYLPRREADRANWLNNFNQKLAVDYGGIFTTPAIMALLGQFFAYYLGLLAQINMLKTKAQDLTKYKNGFCNDPRGSALAAFPGVTFTLPGLPTEGGMWDYISDLVTTIKNHADYTEAIGEDLGVIGAESTFDPLTAQPTLKLKFSASVVIIDFDHPVEVDGVKLLSKRGAETDFTFLAIDTQSPYNDTRLNLVPGQPEKREYKAWFIVDDHIIGLESTIVNIVVNIP